MNRFRIPGVSYGRRRNPAFTMSFRISAERCCKLFIPDREKSPTLPVAGGGARRIRTDDILLAKQPLYQLSYGPSHWCASALPRRAWSVAVSVGGRVVGPIRLELMTSRLSSVRSNQLSYGPIGRSDRISRSAPGLAIVLRTSTARNKWKEKRRRRRSAHLCASSALSGASIVS